jgi:hypothetical protein
MYHGPMISRLLLGTVLGLSLIPWSGALVRRASPRPEVRPAAAHAAAPAAKTAAPRVDFQTQIRPILESRCRPCHFEGGKMYSSLPFDRPETIHKLGNKMFTRIKDPKEQELLRAFLAAR